MGARGMVFRAWVHKQVPLNLQWLVLRIGGTNFFHCWVANSIWLERAESLITSNSFNGGLFRALTKFIAVLPVNNSLFIAYSLFLLGPATHYCESWFKPLTEVLISKPTNLKFGFCNLWNYSNFIIF